MSEILYITFAFISSIVIYILLRKQQRKNTRYIVDTLIFMDHRDRIMRDQDQKWLFDSLYSIDNKVRLPEQQAVVTPKTPAVIYIPKKDPMSEYRGEKDDWHN